MQVDTTMRRALSQVQHHRHSPCGVFVSLCFSFPRKNYICGVLQYQSTDRGEGMWVCGGGNSQGGRTGKVKG